jgi:two-component system KDP operon response regulator KdpE
MTVLLVEDEDRIASFVTKGLGARGFDVRRVSTGGDAQTVATDDVGVVVLDLGLPDIDGLEVLRRLRERSPRLPVVILTARGDVEDRVRGLDLGADDYVAKPFAVGELLARARVALRHAASSGLEPGESTFALGDLRVDLGRRRVWVGDAEVRLTPIEYRLLAVLVRHAGKVLTHRQLLREVWGPAQVEQTHYLRVYMANLRRKLEVDPARPRFLRTEPGVGYRLLTE